MKRFVRYWSDDFMIGFFVAAPYFSWGLTWRTVAVQLIVIVSGAALQLWSEE